MKKLDHRTLRYIAKAYGKNFAGDAENPQASEVPEQAGATGTWESMPPPGYDGSPEANPNVPISPDSIAEAGLTPADDLNAPASPEPVASTEGQLPEVPKSAPPVEEAPKEKTPFEKAGVPDIEGSINEEKQANIDKAAAEQAQGKAEVKAYDELSENLKKLPSANDIAAARALNDQAMEREVRAGHLDPNRWWHNLNTGEKIGAGIALAVGGIGSIIGIPNVAGQFIHGQIQKDIEAQRNDRSDTMNIWKMNREGSKNDEEANLLTENQMLIATKAQIDRAAANARGPVALANAKSLNSLADRKIAENRFKLSLMEPTSDSFGMDPAKKVQWLVPQERQQKVFDEIDAAQNTTRNAPEILKAFDDAANSKHIVDVVPGVDNADQKALHALLGPTFKDVEGTVRQAAMDNMFKNITPQAFDFPRTKAIKRAALIDYLTAKSSAPTASGFGINLQQYPSTNVRASLPPEPGSPAARKQASDKAEVKYDKITGQAYTRDANGKPIPYRGRH